MSVKIKFTATAKEDLRNIALYIAEISGEKSVAINFVNELRNKTKILEDFPESGSLPSDRVMLSSGYRFLVHKDHLIFYRFDHDENTSYILAVFNAKRDYTKVMQKFIQK
jgi:plasmid stabilization system protein ParE